MPAKNNETINNQIRLNYLVGADEEIFLRLPDADKRPYILIGSLCFVASFLFCVDLYIFLGRFFTSVLLKVTLDVAALVILINLNRLIIGRLINNFSGANSLVFGLYGVLIIGGFPLAYVTGIFLSPSYYLSSAYTYHDLVVIVCAIMQLILFAFAYFVISNSQKDLYHSLYAEKQKLINEDLEDQRKKIVEMYKTQLNIRQTRRAVGEAVIADEIDSHAAGALLKRLNEEYTSENLAAVAEFEQRQGDYEKALEYINKAIDIDFEKPELWNMKATILHSLQKPAEEQQAKAKHAELLGAASFKKNLKRSIILQKIELRNLPFFGSFTWKLNPRINVLLGKNGYGKSHLLAIVLAQLQEETTALVDLSRINMSNSTRSPERSFLAIKMGDVDALDEQDYELEEPAGQSVFEGGIIQSSFGKLPVLGIPDLRFINKAGESTYTITDDKAKKLLEYGAYHFISQAPYENAIQNFLNTICNIYYKDSRNFTDEIFLLIRRVFQTLSGNDFRWSTIQPTQDNSGNVIKVMTEGSNEPIPIQKVSQGTLSILSIIGLIFHYLGLRYPNVERSQLINKQAIVFIDEIDAHVHPSWQRKLIGIMRREFPNIQFIITAHSPLIVAGCKEDEVAVMREVKTKNDSNLKGFAVQQISTDFIGYSTDEVYRKIFEIEERDENYEKYISLIPGKSEIETQVKQLENAKSSGALSPSDRSKLTQLQDDLYYIDKAKEKMDSIVDVERTKLENQRLKMELEIQEENSHVKTFDNANP